MRSFAGFLTLILLLSLQGYTGAADGVHKATSKPAWIDVRTEAEYQKGHVDTAINIPHEEIADRITGLELAPDQPIYLYCRSGRRSGIALETLSSLGYTRLTNMGSLEDAQQWLKTSTSQKP